MYIAFTWGRKANFGQVMPMHSEKSDRFIWRLSVAAEFSFEWSINCSSKI